ncbi:unnamed protein product [Didymodactylos carnosus]|uniref:Mono(ADP-ribosyl)transferase n=1 Tax=Didymodactylos carnosus TaxID=1234261 RepID=A0A815G7T1_9BILA|nr:unnamed protein product [Didymodactylos carnosus]CAF1531537.1 unnamed protein product [Didymodactylos carnosus]CAF4192834.1 unnamed protein product [Didymodactylos carnosus]CAF4318611.1 unnamed protein product [Didymodactylos carnosus]
MLPNAVTHNSLRNPIEGCQKQPLILLEEAICPISHLFRNLESHVDLAKKACKNSLNNLTQDQSASIYLYTYELPSGQPSFYQELNRTLRSEQRNTLEIWLPHLKLFLTALYKLHSISDIVWRGVRNIALTQAIYQPDTQVQWWAVTLCTTNDNILEQPQFRGNTGRRTLFSI